MELNAVAPAGGPYGLSAARGLLMVDRIASCWYDRSVNDIDSTEEAREKMTVAPSISELDLRALWHPLTQHKPLADSPPPLMVRGEGCYLEDDQGPAIWTRWRACGV